MMLVVVYHRTTAAFFHWWQPLHIETKSSSITSCCTFLLQAVQRRCRTTFRAQTIHVVWSQLMPQPRSASVYMVTTGVHPTDATCVTVCMPTVLRTLPKETPFHSLAGKKGGKYLAIRAVPFGSRAALA